MDFDKIILQQIKANKLQNLNYDLLLSQLTVVTNKPYAEIKVVVDKLITKGHLKVKGAPEPAKKEKRESPAARAKRNKKSNYFTDTFAPKSPYGSFDDNVDLAYDILKKKEAKTRSKARRVEGKIQMTSKGYAFLLPTDITIEDIFIAERDLNGAMHNDIVIVSVMPNGGRREEGKVVQVIERGNERIVGVLHIVKKIAFVKPDDVKFGKDISIPLSKIGRAVDGDKVVAKITRYYASKRNPDGEIIEVLGKPNDIDTEILAIIRSYGLYDDFPERVKSAASKMPESIDKSQYSTRLDYTNNITFTIDGEDTRDIDDAISIEINSKGNRILSNILANIGYMHS